MKRRAFLRYSTFAGLGALYLPTKSFFQSDFDVQKITVGNQQHWFGYYDKFQIDPSGRYALGMEVDLLFRSPTAEDVITIGLIDLENDNQWTSIGESRAWGWQQGCMLQWRPGSTEEVVWNDREGERYVCRVYNIKTGKKRTLPNAIYTLSPNGQFAVGTAFNRIQYMRPGYGYAGISDPYEWEKAPSEIGVYRMDMNTGESKLIFSLAEAAQQPYNGKPTEGFWNYFNHLLISPDSQRFIFLHRWREGEKKAAGKTPKGRFITRMFTANVDGSDPYILDPSGSTSHFIWKDAKHITAWTKPKGKKPAFYVFKDQTQEVEIVGEEAMTLNGHNTYVPYTKQEWILNDTYPHPDDRKQTLYLYHVPSKEKVILGRFYEPKEFSGEWRCDLHPRCDQQGKYVYFDSTHEGKGRQMYRIDISKIVGQNR